MSNTTIVRENEYVTVNEDGTHTLNLDEIFEGQMTSYPEHIVEGKPMQTIFVKFDSPVKLVDEQGRYLTPGGWDENHYHRKEYEGELVQGPEMFASVKGTMISAHPDARKETAYLISDGDTVIFLGTKFKASSKNWDKRLKFTRI